MRIKENILLHLFFFMILVSGTAFSQQNFGKRCAGDWKGVMYLYTEGILTDSIPVILEVRPQDDSVFRWKMEYVSKKNPMAKDYHLVYKGGNQYIIDEGYGIELDASLFGNRLVSVFESEGILLTSVYVLENDELYFEVSSGTKEKSDAEVQSYHVGFLQNVRFKRN